jgi:small nuclear ribonucleoprotein (snRNP)-like protein
MMKPDRGGQARPEPRHDSDPYAKLLNSKVEAVLSDGSKVSGVLTDASSYAITLENVNGTTVINKAYLVMVVRLR